MRRRLLCRFGLRNFLPDVLGWQNNLSAPAARGAPPVVRGSPTPRAASDRRSPRLLCRFAVRETCAERSTCAERWTAGVDLAKLPHRAKLEPPKTAALSRCNQKASSLETTAKTEVTSSSSWLRPSWLEPSWLPSLVRLLSLVQLSLQLSSWPLYVLRKKGIGASSISQASKLPSSRRVIPNDKTKTTFQTFNVCSIR